MELQPRDYEAHDLLPDFSISNQDTSTPTDTLNILSTPDTSFGSDYEKPLSTIPEGLFDENYGDFAANAIHKATE